MNEVFRRRLIGLAVLLALVFLLTLLLPQDDPAAATGDSPATTVSLTESEPSSPAEPAIPPKPASPPASAPEPSPAPAPEEAPAAPPAHKPAPALKLSPSVTSVPGKEPAQKPKVEAHEVPAPAAARPATPAKSETPPLSPPKPRLAESVAKSPPQGTPSAAPAPSSAAAAWYVQIGSFSDQGKAATIVSLLQKIGYKAETSKIVNGAGATFYRVRLGAFATEAEARQAQQRVARQGYPDARVVGEGGSAK